MADSPAEKDQKDTLRRLREIDDAMAEGGAPELPPLLNTPSGGSFGGGSGGPPSSDPFDALNDDSRDGGGSQKAGSPRVTFNEGAQSGGIDGVLETLTMILEAIRDLPEDIKAELEESD